MTAERGALATAAEAAVARLVEQSIELRACAVLDRDGTLLAASTPGEWSQRAAELWRAADAADPEPAEQVHVGTEDGEVFALRSGDRSAIAVSDRYALASLMLFDLRALLTELERGGAAP